MVNPTFRKIAVAIGRYFTKSSDEEAYRIGCGCAVKVIDVTDFDKLATIIGHGYWNCKTDGEAYDMGASCAVEVYKVQNGRYRRKGMDGIKHFIGRVWEVFDNGRINQYLGR